MAQQINHYNGIINVYKEQGFTSFDVVAKLRGICGQKKIGHTGTLDPDAVGVLPVCLGNATKLCELLTDHDKEYVAQLLLGIATDTQDISGTELGTQEQIEQNKRKAAALLPQQVREVIASFVGEQMQIPPMYSALKVDGQKLCDLARKGIEVERKARPVTFYEIEVLAMDLPLVTMRVRCSKGTYIRTLCNDIGEKLGCGGTMLSLERTQVDVFTKDTARTLSQIQEAKDAGKLEELICSVDSLYMDLRAISVVPSAEKLLLNGNKLKKNMILLLQGAQDAFRDGEQVRVYLPGGAFTGLFAYHEKYAEFTPIKMFLEKNT